MPLPFAAFIPLIASAVGGIIQSINDRANVKRQQRANAALSAQEFAQNQQSITELNKYNDPAAQMARFAGAGLNPNLIYGSGSASAGNQSQPAQYRARETNMAFSNPAQQIPEMISSYQDFQLRQAQIDNVKANTNNLNERSTTEPISRWLKSMLGAKSEAERKKLLTLLPYQAQISGLQADREKIGIALDTQKLGNLRQDELLKLLVREEKTRNLGILDKRSIGLGIDNERKQADLLFQRYKNEWIKQGITTSDNLLIRVFVRMLNETGLIDDVPGMLKKFFDGKNWRGK